jgi:hypothetical protein
MACHGMSRHGVFCVTVVVMNLSVSIISSRSFIAI